MEAEFSFYWFLLAARQGHAEAQTMVGQAYTEAWGATG